MKILIAVEDKVFGKALADFVIDHKWPEDTMFKIIHVEEPLSFARSHDGLSKGEFESYLEERRRCGKSLVMGIGTALRMNFPSANVEEVVLEGHPKEVILDTAAEWKAELIVMGSHGKRGLERLLLGSVSQAVLAHGSCSVAIIRIPAQLTGDEEKESETNKKHSSLRSVILV